MTKKALVERLVEHDSPSGQERAVAEFLVSELAGRGFDARLDDVGNAVGVIGHGAFQVYLVGHMDTVPGKIPVRVQENSLYGRGSVDAKGALAAFVEAAAHMSESQALTLTVVGCVEEEAHSRGARHILEALPPADAVVIGEPSGWAAVTLGYKGSVSMRYDLVLPRAHQGADQATATETVVAFYQGLCERFPEHGPGFDEVSLNLVSINSRPRENHELVELHLNVRMPPGFDWKVLQAEVDALKRQAEVAWTDPVPAVLADKRNPLVSAFLGAIRTEGGRPRFKRKTGTSDMNLLQAWGCPILAYGPGDSALDHAPDEHLDLAEYALAIKVLSQALINLEMSVARRTTRDLNVQRETDRPRDLEKPEGDQ